MSEKRMVVDPNKIHILGVQVKRAHFEASTESSGEPLENTQLKIGLKSESGFNYDEHLVRFRLFVKIVLLDEHEEPTGTSGDYLIEFNFEIENLLDFVEEEEGEKVVSNTLGATIAGISYSTSRGIILDRTQATELNGVLLPVIDPNRLLGEDSFSEL
jgi:hypothetical protein